MFKLFVFCFAILTLICGIQCTPTAVRRNYPSVLPKRGYASPLPKRGYASPVPKRGYASPVPKRGYASPLPKRDYASPLPKRHHPDTLVIRGLCDFLCPQENMVGVGLSEMTTDSGRLYCRYDVEEVADNAFCMYNRNTGAILSSSSPSECDQQAAFHCPGTKNGQEEMESSPSQPKDSRSGNLPRFVRERSRARRAVGVDTV